MWSHAVISYVSQQMVFFFFVFMVPHLHWINKESSVMLMPTAIIRGQAVEVGGCCQQAANHLFSLLMRLWLTLSVHQRCSIIWSGKNQTTDYMKCSICMSVYVYPCLRACWQQTPCVLNPTVHHARSLQTRYSTEAMGPVPTATLSNSLHSKDCFSVRK